MFSIPSLPNISITCLLGFECISWGIYFTRVNGIHEHQSKVSQDGNKEKGQFIILDKSVFWDSEVSILTDTVAVLMWEDEAT